MLLFTCFDCLAKFPVIVIDDGLVAYFCPVVVVYVGLYYENPASLTRVALEKAKATPQPQHVTVVLTSGNPQKWMMNMLTEINT